MIHIELNGLRKVVTNWTVESGSLVLDLELKELNGIKFVYIIGEVIYSERVFMEMKLSDGKLADEISNVPVAFSYMKFPVDKDGILQVVLLAVIFFLQSFALGHSVRSCQRLDFKTHFQKFKECAYKKCLQVLCL